MYEKTVYSCLYDVFGKWNDTIVYMQSAPGAGKSTLVEKLIDKAEDNNVSWEVCSADNYWIDKVTQEYKFDITQLHKAHEYCKNQFIKALNIRTQLIIIDNTNVDLKAIRNYYDETIGYQYKIVRPNTPWYFDAEECFKKNTHNVPLETIQRMINSIKKFSLENVKADIIWI